MNCAKFFKHVFTFCSTALALNCYSQLTVNPTQPAAVLAAKLAGPGIAISSPVLTCAGVANGTFVSVSTPITIDSGILLTSGRSVATIGPESILASTSNGTPGDPSLTALAMATTYDACALEFDFVPDGDTVSFNYQFGSEEYINSTCGPYNDAFAFFISGPGITGSQNMALIPGTNIPITVNSVNNGVPGPGLSLSNCTIMGSGSPFTSYYVNNFGGLLLTYRGFTMKMAAVHDVIPCNTYHLKMAICDAGNRLYDSGVFIEAGSLKTNSVGFDHAAALGATINGVPNAIVKGCTPAKVRVNSSRILGISKTVHFAYGGTAIRDTDYSTVDSAIIAAGTDSVFVNIPGLPTVPGGTKTLQMYIVSATCGILDSITINILDSPSAHILTPDTTICKGFAFPIRTTGTAGLDYAWTPATDLSSAAISQPTASPAAGIVYTMTATLLNSGCPPMVGIVSVAVTDVGIQIQTPDTIICIGNSVNINASGAPGQSYKWAPPTGLSDFTVVDPVATPTGNVTYTVVVTSPDGLCTTTAMLSIIVGNPTAGVVTSDTSICRGSKVIIDVEGDTSLSYSWLPVSDLSDPNAMRPTASPQSTRRYFFTAYQIGTPCFITDSIKIDVTNPSIVNITPNETIPYGGSVQLYSDGGLFYTWAPDDGSLSNANINNPIASPVKPTIYTVTAIDKNGCKDTASVKVDVYFDTLAIPGAFTPNGDGLNDVFKIEHLGYYRIVDMRIFNRWGNEIYRTTGGQSSGWDGTFNGSKQDIGVYNYELILASPEGVLSSYKGTVTLLR